MSRFDTVAERIDKSVTGLNASCYIHADFDKTTGQLMGVRISHKRKEEGQGLDKLFTALGDTLTDILASRK